MTTCVIVLHPQLSSLLNDASLAHPIAIPPERRSELTILLRRLLDPATPPVPKLADIWQRFDEFDAAPCLMAALFVFHRLCHCSLPAIDALMQACRSREWYAHVQPAPVTHVCPLWSTLKPELYRCLLELKVSACPTLQHELLSYPAAAVLVDPTAEGSPLDRTANARGFILMDLAAKLRQEQAGVECLQPAIPDQHNAVVVAAVTAIDEAAAAAADV